MTSDAPSEWYADPFGRYQHRYWDGNQWTAHVATQGHQDIDAPVPNPPPSPMSQVPMPMSVNTFVPRAESSASTGVDESNSKVVRIVSKAGAAGTQMGGGTLFTEPVLVVSQKAKIVEINAQYDIFDQHGQRVGAVREVGQGLVRNALSVRPPENRTRRLQIIDTHDRIVMTLTRPAQLVRSTVVVRDAGGAELGKIVQKTVGVVKKVHFTLESGGTSVGSLNGEGWHDSDFHILDNSGREAARINRALKGLTNKRFAKTDAYIVQIPQPSPEPLRSLVVAAALVIDTVLRQGGHDARRGRRTNSHGR